MSRLKLEIDPQDFESNQHYRQFAFKTFAAFHVLHAGSGHQDMLNFLSYQKERIQDLQNECEDITVLRWMQGAVQIIDSFIDNIRDCRQKMEEARGV